MITLMIGTPDSGKSARAEKLAVQSGQGKKKAYIATMIPYGIEGEKRVEKHKKLREGKDFITYEMPTDVDKLVPFFRNDRIEVALLECISNLVGNEMYKEENQGLSDEQMVRLVVDEVERLSEAVQSLVIVSNQFEKAPEYDAETHRYIRITTAVNLGLKQMADECHEIVDGNWVINGIGGSSK